MPKSQQPSKSRPLPSVEELLEQSQEVRDTADELTAIGYAVRGEEVREFCLNVEAYLTRSETGPTKERLDEFESAVRYATSVWRDMDGVNSAARAKLGERYEEAKQRVADLKKMLLGERGG